VGVEGWRRVRRGAAPVPPSQPFPATASAEGRQFNGAPFPASVTAEGAQLNVPPFPASATAEGRQFNGAPSPAMGLPVTSCPYPHTLLHQRTAW